MTRKIFNKCYTVSVYTINLSLEKNDFKIFYLICKQNLISLTQKNLKISRENLFTQAKIKTFNLTNRATYRAAHDTGRHTFRVFLE
jgi:hypothetical protein